MAASLTQSFESIVIPSTEEGDPEAVVSSLALARQDFARGELREALRHLRRAAEGADDAGSEVRAVALARAAADLASAVGPYPATVTRSSSAPTNPREAARESILEPSLRELMASGRAVPVVVKRSTRDPELYVLRRASTTNSGKRAVIVLLEDDESFFEKE